MHKHVEAGQSLTASWLNQTYLDLVRLYYGHQQGVCQVEDYIRSEWIGIPHLLFNYYIYQYSIGEIASLALSDMVLREGSKGAERYLEFLSAGGSDYPLETLKKAGVDMSRPDAANAAFHRINTLLDEMEKIIVRLHK
jgi:oligoendopeptidase F